MTVILSDDFTTVANWTGSGTAVAGGRTGNCMSVAGSGGSTYTIPLASRVNTIKLTVWWQANNVTTAARTIGQIRSGAINLATFQTDATAHVLARIGATAGTLVGTSTATVAINTWNQLQCEMTWGVTNGRLLAWLNGVQFANSVNVDTKLTSTTTFDTIALSGPGSGTTAKFDDFLLEDPTAVVVKTWNGTAWVDAPVKVWNGTAFVAAVAVKTWNGTAWVP